jgi:serine/threonine protein kinase
VTPDTQEGALVGTVVGGYQLMALLGAGGMAEVYRARDPRSGREVAIKILPEALAQELSYVDRFREEAQRVSALDHPNVVKVYYFGADAGRYYLTMPVVPESLRDRMDRVGTLKPLDAARIAIQVAAGLDAAHAQGLVHRDVKPENILLNEQDVAMLTDFGIAREIDVLRDANTTRTPAITGLPVGTPEYMAPEQLRGGVADQRMDVYGLGAVLYEMLTGRVPHQAETPFEVAVKALTEPLLPPSFFSRAITPELEQVVLNALAHEQHDRYPNMRSFAAALRRAVLEGAIGSGPMAEAVAALGPLPTGQPTRTRQFAEPVPRPPRPMVGLPSASLSTSRGIAGMGPPAAASTSGVLSSKHPPRSALQMAARSWPMSQRQVAPRAEQRPATPATASAAPSADTISRAAHPIEAIRTAPPHQGSLTKPWNEPLPQPKRTRRRGISPRIALATGVLALAVVAFGGLAVTGNLRGAFGGPDTSLSVFSRFAAPTATSTAIPPTTTPKPALSVAPTSVDACHDGSFTILYTGAASSITWTATAPAGVTLTPSSGTLTSGVPSQPIVVSAAQSTSGSISVTLPMGQAAQVAVSC